MIRHSCHTPGAKNKDPILQVLKRIFNRNEPNQFLLEISSGLGLHNISQPCTEWINDGNINYRNTAERVDYMLNINMLHVTSFACAEGLFRNASQLLKPGGLLVTYGPYAVDGTLEPESNVSFNKSLQERCPEWGVRDTRELQKLATFNRMTLEEMVDLPTNNKCLIWKKLTNL